MPASIFPQACLARDHRPTRTVYVQVRSISCITPEQSIAFKQRYRFTLIYTGGFGPIDLSSAEPRRKLSSYHQLTEGIVFILLYYQYTFMKRTLFARHNFQNEWSLLPTQSIKTWQAKKIVRTLRAVWRKRVAGEG